MNRIHSFCLLMLLCISAAFADAYEEPIKNTNPDTTATTASWEANTLPMEPWLIKWDANGQPVKTHRLSFEISGSDTLYYKGDCLIEDQRVRWYPKSLQDNRMHSAYWTARRSMYAALLVAGYQAREADSLCRTLQPVIDGQKDSRPLLNQIMAAAPNIHKLNMLEHELLAMQQQMVTVDMLNEFAGDIDAALSEHVNFAETVDDFLNQTRGKKWGRAKRAHSLFLTSAPPSEERCLPSTEEMPMPSKF
ncbi:hypothetical protein H6761_01725 [Candidatus Nomurabacteria bacterium]|nr:hypothetical protein [Candidatus Nomurabacteria bacterium]